MPEENWSLIKPETPWQRARKRSKSKIQETRMGKLPGASPQVNSGRIWSSLRDNKLKSFIGVLLIDNKTTDNPENESYRIERKKWLELRRDSNRTPPGCLPGLQVDLKEVHLLVIELDMWRDVEKHVMWLEDQIQNAKDELDRHMSSLQNQREG